MMFELFTVEEVNMMCIFNISSKETLIARLTAAASEFDEPELDEIAQSVLAKLSKINDAEFVALELCPVYDDYDEEV